MFNKDFANGVLWAVATIVLAILFGYGLWDDYCPNISVVSGTLMAGLYWRFKNDPQ